MSCRLERCAIPRWIRSANARKKALALHKVSGLAVLADDSGLAVDAMGGRPGVHSARYAGQEATDEDNNRKLLEELEGISPENRRAAFVCVMVLVGEGGCETVTEGRCEGVIATKPRGHGGFGYDPVFLLDDGRAMAELTREEKNAISHRGRALREMAPHLFALKNR